MENKNSPVFNLVIDEERCELMQVMFGMMVKDWHNFERAFPHRADPLKKCGLELIKEVSEKMHEHGWCKDPDCEDKKN